MPHTYGLYPWTWNAGENCHEPPEGALQAQADSAELSFDWHVTETAKQTEQRIGVIGAVLRAQPRMLPFVERLLLISEKMGN